MPSNKTAWKRITARHLKNQCRKIFHLRTLSSYAESLHSSGVPPPGSSQTVRTSKARASNMLASGSSLSKDAASPPPSTSASFQADRHMTHCTQQEGWWLIRRRDRMLQSKLQRHYLIKALNLYRRKSRSRQ